MSKKQSIKKRKYDLPLDKKAGTGFILWIIALMTFLCALALSGSFLLSDLAQKWENGLSGQGTVEIKAQLKEKDGAPVIDEAGQLAIKGQVIELLKSEDAISSYQELRPQDIKDLINPWFEVLLENDQLMKEFPLPLLIAIEVDTTKSFNKVLFQQKLKSISSDVYLDTHEEWLNHMVMLTYKIRLVAFILSLIIGSTAIVAVIGAVKSRLSMHFSDIELLHLMGASDDYVAKQFSKHSALMTLQGCAIGAFVLIAVIASFIFLQHEGEDLIPMLRLDVMHWIALLLLPIIGGSIAYFTAGATTKKFLKRLP